jgi:hypothetical protein
MIRQYSTLHIKRCASKHSWVKKWETLPLKEAGRVIGRGEALGLNKNIRS